MFSRNDFVYNISSHDEFLEQFLTYTFIVQRLET